MEALDALQQRWNFQLAYAFSPPILLSEKGLAYRTIMLHRSILSATLPPFDGRDVGQHPLVSLLVRVFQRRPPERLLYKTFRDISF